MRWFALFGWHKYLGILGMLALRCKLKPYELSLHILMHPNWSSHQTCCLALLELEQQLACSLWSHQCQPSDARSDHLSQSVISARHDMLICCCRLGIWSKSLFGLCLQKRPCHRLRPGRIRPQILACLRAAGPGGTLRGDPCLRSGLRSSLRSRAAEGSWMTKAGLLTSGTMLVFCPFKYAVSITLLPVGLCLFANSSS